MPHTKPDMCPHTHTVRRVQWLSGCDRPAEWLECRACGTRLDILRKGKR